MLSIIISSFNKYYFEKLEKNISETIGIEFEIIQILNLEGKKGISQVYNEGAQKAKFSYLLFLHEDVNFLNYNWGQDLIKLFKTDSEIGLIGIAGCTYKSRAFSGWWQPTLKDYEPKRGNLVQHFKIDHNHPVLRDWNPNKVELEEVICVDGVFLAIPKAQWLLNPFDETLLKSFHGYDMDISLTIGLTKKIIVALNIQIEHYSEGSFNLEWFKENLKIHEKWAVTLPRISDNYLTYDQINGLSPKLINECCGFLIDRKVGFSESIKLIRRVIRFTFGKNYPWRVFWEIKTFLSLVKIRILGYKK